MHFSISWLGLVVSGHFLRDTILPVFSSLQTIIFWRVPPPQLAEQKLQPPNSHTYLSLALLSSRFKKYLKETVVEIPWCIVFFATISYRKFTIFKIEENWFRIENMVCCNLTRFFFLLFYCILICTKFLSYILQFHTKMTTSSNVVPFASMEYVLLPRFWTRKAAPWTIVISRFREAKFSWTFRLLLPSPITIVKLSLWKCGDPAIVMFIYKLYASRGIIATRVTSRKFK